MTFEAMYTDLQKGIYQPVYFLCGEESYFIDKVSDHIEQHALTESEKAFNQIILYGKDVDHKVVVDNARQYPMMSTKRVVIVKEAQNMRGIDDLLPYIENPSPHTILLIVHKYKKPDKRKAFGKAVSKKTCYLETKKLYDNQVGPWINKYLISSGVQIDRGADQLIAEYLGTDLSKIANELDKMLLNIGESKYITPDIIHENIGISKDYNVFELQNAFGLKNKVKSYRIIRYFAQNSKQHPIPMLVGSLYNYFCKLLIAKVNISKGDNALMNALGLSSSFFIREYKQACQKFTQQELKEIIRAIAKADRHSKGIGARRADHKAILMELAAAILNT